MNLYKAEIPECFGYGISVLCTTRAKALEILKRRYNQLNNDYKSKRDFEDAYEYFGGYVCSIELDQPYNEGLS